MITIRALLDRIRWDRDFGRGQFAIGYYDRVAERVIVVAFDEVWFDPGDHFAMQVMDSDGREYSVPLHRVCEVYRDGERIWARRPQAR